MTRLLRQVSRVTIPRKVVVEYLNCPRCGLAIHLRDQRFTRSECPRCRHHAAVSMPMFTTRGGPSTVPAESRTPGPKMH